MPLPEVAYPDVIVTRCSLTNCNNISSRIQNDRHYCQSCFSRFFTHCDSCDEITHVYDTHQYAGVAYCASCYSDIQEDTEGLGHCNSCGDNFDDEEIIWLDGSSYCIHCKGGRIVRLPNTTFQKNRSRRTVGFEIEFCVPQCPADLNQYGKIKEDGSIIPDKSAHSCKEFASSITAGDATFDLIDNVCEILRKHKAYVNKSCGLHIHLGMSRSTEDQRHFINQWWSIFEPVFFAIVSPSRRANEYTNWTTAVSEDNRYRSLNICSYGVHETFEVRLHQGSLDPHKIKHWISVLLSFFDTFSKIPPTPIRVNRVKRLDQRELLIYFYNKLKLKLDLRKYVLSRIKEFDKGLGYSYKTIKNLKKKVIV